MTSHERAAEVDTQLADLWEREGAAHQSIAQTIQSLHTSDGQRRDYRSRSLGWEVSDEDTEASVRAKLADTTCKDFWFSSPEVRGGEPYLFHTGIYAKARIEELDANRVLIVELREQQRPLELEYVADPWQRFFLVTNTGGHIHSSRSCSTTFPTTQWAWLPHLSGLTEDEAVKDQGPRLCSVCFPSAPVEWTLGLPKAPRCPGSGQRVEANNPRAWKQYGTCPTCGESFALSQTGAIRAHKPKA